MLIQLYANIISEQVTYNWYNQSGALIASGRDINYLAQQNEEITLEVIAAVDGVKDYDKINVDVAGGIINSIDPNPAQSNISINYTASTNATIALVNAFSNNLYSVSSGTDELNIDLTQLNMGQYLVLLIINNQIVDAKPFIKL